MTDGVARLPVTDVDPEVLNEALRLVALLKSARPSGRFAIRTFLAAADEGMGGTLILRAPAATRTKRENVEAEYVTEGVTVSATGTV